MEISIGNINAEVIVIADTIVNGNSAPATDGDDDPTDEVRPQ